MTPGTERSYADLLRSLQPRSIKNDDEAEAIQRQIDALIDQDEISTDEQELLSLLGDLMLAWEGNLFDLPDLAPPEAIQALLEAHGLRQSDLVGPVFATRSIASEVLNGKRRLTYEHVQKLAQLFHVSPSVFFTTERPSSLA